MSTVGKVY